MEAVRDRSVDSDLQQHARLAQKLAKELRAAGSAREAFEISRELARVSKEIEKASRAVDEYEKAMRAAGY